LLVAGFLVFEGYAGTGEGGVIEPINTLLSPYFKNDHEKFGVTFMAVPVVILVLLLLTVSAVGIHYEVGDDGILIVQWYHKRYFPRETIRSLQKLDAETTASKTLTPIYNNGFERVSAIADYLRFIRYSTVNVEITDRKRGKMLVPSDHARAFGDYVLLTTNDDKEFLLSPNNVGALLGTARGCGIAVVSPSHGANLIDNKL
jgi:hypothetical protein